MRKKWLWAFLAGLLLLATGIAGAIFYGKALRPNTPDPMPDPILLVPAGATLEDVIDSLLVHRQLLDERSFRWTAGKMDYTGESIRRGRFTIPPGIGNRALVSLLRGGRQTPLKVTIQNVRTIDQLCGRVAARLAFDSTDLVAYLDSRFDSLAGTAPETRLTRFIPNTYEFYWTISPEDFCQRMLKEYDRFWNEERMRKLATTGLDRDQAYTLASIIEKETNYNPEKPRMAGVYLNRLRLGMPLQADPTVVFAIGDFEIRRVLYDHLAIDSPYNTYKNTGLPPGPIFMPGIASIDAVLDHENHDYVFFCAQSPDDGPGHSYAVTLSAHNENARRYQRWLDRQGIR